MGSYQTLNPRGRAKKNKIVLVGVSLWAGQPYKKNGDRTTFGRKPQRAPRHCPFNEKKWRPGQISDDRDKEKTLRLKTRQEESEENATLAENGKNLPIYEQLVEPKYPQKTAW